jgi:predicted ATPase
MDMNPGFVKALRLKREEISSFAEYPFSIPAIKTLDRLELHPAVTFFVGENGSGKSTLIEALAVKAGFNAEGGSKNFNFATRESHSSLFQHLVLERSHRKPADNYFLRAESFYNVASAVENLGVTGYGDRSLHEQSHGESFFALLRNRLRGNGLYIFDEPEAALSPQRQLSMLVIIDQLVSQGSQLIITTHSPILMAYPSARIYELTSDGINAVAYTETEHYRITKDFLSRHEQMLAVLLDRLPLRSDLPAEKEEKE